MKHRGGPRSGKFAEIKSLQAKQAPERHQEVRDTLEEFNRDREATELEEDADVRVNRNRYAQLVARFRSQASHYNSVGLFVETMMREVSLNEDPAFRAAAATWALHLLATQPSQHALSEVIRAILPAVYCSFDPERLPYPSAAVQLQVKDPDTIYWNPYFTHTMYLEQVDVDKGNVDQLAEALKQVLSSNNHRRDFVIRFIENERMNRKRATFHAWASYVRRIKILNTININKNRRHQDEMDRYRLHAVFYQWKVQLEVSRSSFLKERLHEAAAQLENAKNQFQLQCYRADRLIQTTKEAKEELEHALSLNAGYVIQVKYLQEELVRKEKEYGEKLVRSVQSAFDMAQRYREALSRFHEMLPPPPTYLEETPDFREEIDDEVNLLLGYAEEESEATTYAETLLQWCNGVLYSQCPKKDEYAPIRNFGSDFSSGEAFYELLKFVAPTVAVTLPPNCDREFRLNRLREMCQKLQMCFVLDVVDFSRPVEDRITLAVAELFRRYIADRWSTTSLRSFRLLEAENDPNRIAPTKDEEEAAAMRVNSEEDFVKYLAECQTYLEDIKSKVSPQVNLERQLAENHQRIAQGESYLTAQRLNGMPVPHVGSWSLRHFWMVNPKSLADLKDTIAANLDPLLWSQLLKGPLKVCLRDNAETTARVFYLFAGQGGKTLSETTFWRFIETFGIASSTTTKEHISLIFDRVASPQLSTLLKGQGKSEEESKALLQAARQEMDIRQVTAIQFTEILLRIGSTYYGNSFGLVEGVGKFLTWLRSNKSVSVHPSLSSFWSTESQDVFRFFGDDLARIFFFYTKKQEGSMQSRERAFAVQDGGRFGSLLSTNYFIAMLRDCEYIAENNSYIQIYTTDCHPRMFITAQQAEQLVLSLQEQYEHSRAGELTFTLFIDALCSICCYWCPDPFVHTSRKFACFISDMITQLITQHTGSTLILGEPPVISLKGEKRVTFF